MTDLDREVAQAIDGIRKRRGYSLRGLAAETARRGYNFSEDALYGLFSRPNARVTATHLVAFCEILKVKFEDLLPPQGPCSRCSGKPPAGFTCNACGRSEESP